MLRYFFYRQPQIIAQRAPASPHLVAAQCQRQRNAAKPLGPPTAGLLDTIEEPMHQHEAAMLFQPAKLTPQNLLISIMLLPVLMDHSTSSRDLLQMKLFIPSLQLSRVVSSKLGSPLVEAEHQHLGKKCCGSCSVYQLIRICAGAQWYQAKPTEPSSLPPLEVS